jgi:hypothetical protein
MGPESGYVIPLHCKAQMKQQAKDKTWIDPGAPAPGGGSHGCPGMAGPQGQAGREDSGAVELI